MFYDSFWSGTKSNLRLSDTLYVSLLSGIYCTYLAYKKKSVDTGFMYMTDIARRVLIATLQVDIVRL